MSLQCPTNCDIIFIKHQCQIFNLDNLDQYCFFLWRTFCSVWSPVTNTSLTVDRCGDCIYIDKKFHAERDSSEWGCPSSAYINCTRSLAEIMFKVSVCKYWNFYFSFLFCFSVLGLHFFLLLCWWFLSFFIFILLLYFCSKWRIQFKVNTSHCLWS